MLEQNAGSNSESTEQAVEQATPEAPKLEVVIRLLKDGNKSLSVTSGVGWADVRELISWAAHLVADEIMAVTLAGVIAKTAEKKIVSNGFRPSNMFNRLFKG